MKVSDFDFELPEELIATRPVSPRDSARLLVVRPGEPLVDAHVRDLTQWLRAGDVLVLNNTRVIPARLYGWRGEVKAEVLLHKEIEPGVWRCFARPGKRLKAGNVIRFDDALEATVERKDENGEIVLRFNCAPAALPAALEKAGRMPLPPYIESKRAADAQDAQDYQTVFAEHEGSVAAPTAGLHFTPELLAALEAKGVHREFVTLHVGGGTFLPVKVEDTSEHVMHSEFAVLAAETAARLNAARKAGGRIVAVGTTAARTLESAADEGGVLHAFAADTAIFITPGYRFRAVDVLMTNFHLPRSTLVMLVSAFAGTDTMRNAYKHAISDGYRFYSYGDSSLLFLKK